MNQKPVISLSPHVYSETSIKSLMWGVVIALIPAFAVSIFAFGWDAVRVVFISVAGCFLCEYTIQKFLLKKSPTLTDGSAVITGILLAFNVPANLPWWILLIGAAVAIGVGKMSFGGLGNNPFNPALVGRVFMLISFPVHMTSWPRPQFAGRAVDGMTGATPLAVIKEGLKNGEPLSQLLQDIPSFSELLLGKMAGSLGEISALALLIGFGYMLYKKIITWHIPVSVIGTVVVFTGIFWLIDPQSYADPVFHLLSGGLMLGAVFMATDYVTSPMTIKGMVIFGIGIGLLTAVIRLFGAYPEGISFAILIMNGFVPLINKYCKPHRFGEGGQVA
ncbi:MAG: RnfABCDGE type electron transport complex subunit D [Candidatus Omnitrophota bacterium]